MEGKSSLLPSGRILVIDAEYVGFVENIEKLGAISW